MKIIIPVGFIFLLTMGMVSSQKGSANNDDQELKELINNWQISGKSRTNSLADSKCLVLQCFNKLQQALSRCFNVICKKQGPTCIDTCLDKTITSQCRTCLKEIPEACCYFAPNSPCCIKQTDEEYFEPANCACNEHTEIDHLGRPIGQCLAKYDGKFWCYIQDGKDSTCADKKRSIRGIDPTQWWSYIPCSIDDNFWGPITG